MRLSTGSPLCSALSQYSAFQPANELMGVGGAALAMLGPTSMMKTVIIAVSSDFGILYIPRMNVIIRDILAAIILIKIERIGD